MNTTAKSIVRVRLVLAVVVALMVLPAPNLRADVCGVALCPFPPVPGVPGYEDSPLCTAELKSLISICRKTGAVEAGITTVNETLANINSAYQGASSELAKLEEELQRIQEGSGVVSDTAAFFDQFVATMNAFNAETLAMSQDMASRVEEARAMADFYLRTQHDRYVAFVGSGCATECQQLRFDLLQLVAEMEGTFNLAIVVLAEQMPADMRSELTAIPRIDLSSMTLLIEEVPGVFLFPVNEAVRALGSAGGPGVSPIETQIEYLSRIREALQALSEILSTINWVADGGTSLCVELAKLGPGVSEEVRTWATVVTVIAKVAFEIGGVLETVGLTAVDEEGGISFAANVKGAIKKRPVRAVGMGLKGVATLVSLVSDTIASRVQACQIIVEQQITHCVLHANKAKSFDECRQAVYDGQRFGF